MSLSRYTDKIHMIMQDVHAGKNYINARLDFHDHNEITTTDNFVDLSSNSVIGSWWRDGGDIAMPQADREPRAICRVGKCSFTATGKTIIVRVMLNPGFGTAAVRIDGVVPSTISGVLSPTDEINCDSEEHNSWGNEYIDIVLADNLADEDHLVELYCDNASAGTGGYVPISGYKTINSSLAISKSAWLLPYSAGQNETNLLWANASGKTIKNLTVTYQAGLKDSGGDQIPNLSEASVLASATAACQFTPDFEAADPGQNTVQFEVSAEYEDPDGTIETEVTSTIDSHDETAITYSSGWTLDESNGENRAFAETINKTATMTFTGSSFTIRVQKDYGWGKLDLYVDTVLTSTVDCHDAIGGGFYTYFTYTGFSSGSHTLQIKNKLAKPAPFAVVMYQSVKKFTAVAESFKINYQVAHVPPYAPASPTLAGDILYYDPVHDAQDLTLPRSNIGATKTIVQSRFPTYCVYYAGEAEETLEKYDIVIIDPHAVSRAFVARLQDKGIKVIAYISFGEEDGTIANPYQPSSDKSPWTGDGTGPGGYAGYYCKGGNLFGEQSECANDRQRVEGVKACALSRAEFLAAPGRCSPVCGNDWRTGYSEYSAGGVCSAGHTKDTYWSRSASVACQNGACPNYSPQNQGCPAYSQASGAWGQDYSIEDSTFPDENGIWGSYYINPIVPSWKQRIIDYYMPSCVGTATTYMSESHVLTTETTDNGDGPCFRASHYPIDPGETVTVVSSLGYTFTTGRDYSYDAKLGTFVMTPDTEQGAPAVAAGDTVYVSYTRLGLQADGIFMDTVDTVDVYPSTAFQTAFATMINELKADYPDVLFCSNRGFTILGDIIQSCEFVMFESFLSDYNWDNDTYSLITNPDSIAFNNGILDQLKQLRRTNVFDVFALNYCHNGSAGDELRQVIYDTCRGLGFMCWTSTILLNDPEDLTTITSASGPFRTNAWRNIRERPIVEQSIPE